MDANFQISVDDYVTAGQLNGQMSKKSKKIHFLIDMLLVLSGFIAIYFGKHIWAGALIGASIGANLLPFLISKFYIPWYLRRHYKKYKVLKKPVSAVLTPSGINFRSDGGEGLLNWSEIHSWRENDSLLLIYLAPKIYYMVPKRISEMGFPIDELKRKLLEHTGTAI